MPRNDGVDWTLIFFLGIGGWFDELTNRFMSMSKVQRDFVVRFFSKKMNGEKILYVEKRIYIKKESISTIYLIQKKFFNQ